MANAIALNATDESQIRRRRLPLELQCELFTALPLEHASRLLLLSDGINNNCIGRVRKLREKWREFSDPRVDKLVQRYHYRLHAKIKAIEEAHLDVNPAAQYESTKLHKRISHDRAELSPWVGANSVQRATGAVTRHGVMTELVNSIAHMHGFIEKNKKRLKEADEEFNNLDRKAHNIMSKLVPLQLSKQILSAAGSERFAERLRRDYLAHIGATRARLCELKEENRKMQTGVRKQLCKWSSEVQKHHDIIIAQWKAINTQNASDKFDATVWRAQVLGELKAKDALTIASDCTVGRCACSLGRRF
uniref:F-box domain-containing protein n=1 Tax=Globodera rostochiensis TaxID=31243 RepID=A0A914HIN7_GLORO